MPTISEQYLSRAINIIPGGVNSPVRAFGAVGGSPIFIKSAQGPYIYSEDGDQYIDYVGSWGPLILGHCDHEVIEQVQATACNGLSFGAPTVLEIELAEKIIQIMPNIEKIRMVNSGTEATMSALRLARGFTKKNKIVKFIGCYHGHSDSLLVKAGSGLLTFNNKNTASSAGVPQGVIDDTLLANFNDLDSVVELFEKHTNDIAAIIIEPIPGNMNMVLPKPEFLQGLRELCDHHQSILIFDEVMSGFRVALGGAQSIYGIKPDLTTLGKVIGGGMPVGAFGGRKEIMDCLSPVGDVYQAGTLSGNPIAMAAGLATLNKISKPGFFDNLAFNTKALVSGIKEVMQARNINFYVNNLGGMFGLFFTKFSKNSETSAINNFTDVTNCDSELFNKFFHLMLKEGVYFAPSAYEAGFVSAAHSNEIISETLNRVDSISSLLL